MAVNKNFVVKNGLEVGTDLILANTTNSRVGIGTSLPTDTLHVNGGIAGTDFVISGIATIPTLNSTTGTITNLSATTISMGSTAIVNSARQLQNIASLDATTTATIESAIEAGPNTFANLNITGVSTFVGLATFGSGIEVQSGVSTFTGIVDINGGGRANTFQVEDLTADRVVYASTSGELVDSNDLKFAKTTLTAANLQVTGVTTSSGLLDANGGANISGGSGLVVTNGSTLASAVIGGIGTFNSDGANVLGIVTATAFHGDISNTTGVSTNIVASVGIQSGGNVVGAGITALNFIGAGNSILVNGSNPAIVDIQISGGGGAGAATSVGGSAPADPALGQLWYNNELARTFIWYDEEKLSLGTTAYWVDASPFDMQGQFLEKTGDNMGGALGISSGSLSAPGLYINGSTNTGIAAFNSNEFSFISSGTEKFNVNASGARIVGTTTVTGNINAIDGVFTGNVTVGGTLTKQDVTNVDSIGVVTARQGVYFGNAGAGTLIQGNSNGVVVGGTLSSVGINSSSPSGTLDVTTTAGAGSTVFIYAANHNTSAVSQAELRFGFAHSGSPEGIGYIKLKENGTNAFDGNLTFGVPNNNGSGGSVTNDVLTIKGSNQNVGIGTDIPQNTLHLEQPGGAVIRLTRLTNSSGNAQISFSGTDVNLANNGGASGKIKFSNNGSEKLHIGASGQLGIGGNNYGTAGQVLKSAGNSTTVTWDDATVGVSSGGTSIGNATTLNFIGAGNTFAINSGTVDISISGGGGGSGQFNTGLSGEFHGTCTGIGSTVFTFPSTAGAKYILTSLFATNVAAGNTDVNVIAAFDFNGGERSYMGYNIPIPLGMAAELLRQPQVLNPSDKVLLRSTDIDRNGADSIVEYYGTYETQSTGTDYQGVGLGVDTLNSTSATTLYTSSGAPSVLQSIRVANISDAGPKPITISIIDGSETIRFVENLIVPKYGSIEILDNQKRIASGAIVKVTLDEASTMGVQLSAKKIAA